MPKYRDIELELEQSLEAMAIVIGAGFVAAQSILTTTFSRVKGLATLQVIQVAGGTSLPKTKAELFKSLLTIETVCLTSLESTP
jgi:hypothetical protein